MLIIGERAEKVNCNHGREMDSINHDLECFDKYPMKNGKSNCFCREVDL